MYRIFQWRRKMGFSIFRKLNEGRGDRMRGSGTHHLLNAKLTSTWPTFPLPILLHISALSLSRLFFHLAIFTPFDHIFWALFLFSLYFPLLHFLQFAFPVVNNILLIFIIIYYLISPDFPWFPLISPHFPWFLCFFLVSFVFSLFCDDFFPLFAKGLKFVICCLSFHFLCSVNWIFTKLLNY